MDIHARLQQLLRERGWTEYRLSKECNLSQTTIGNVIRRNSMPSLATLETISRGFGITLAQLLAEGEMVELTPELKEVFDCWRDLTPDQKKAALAMIKAMNHDSLTLTRTEILPALFLCVLYHIFHTVHRVCLQYDHSQRPRQ